MIKNREIPPMHPASATDFLPLPQLRDLQFTRLKDMGQRAYDRVALFRKRMDERKLKPADLHTMDDIVKLPFTVKGSFTMSSIPRRSAGLSLRSSIRLWNRAT